MTLTEFVATRMPAWVIGAIIMIVPAALVLVAYLWFIRRLIRLAGRYSPFLQKLLARGQSATSTILVIIALGLALPAANFPAPVTAVLGRALLVGWRSRMPGRRARNSGVSRRRTTSNHGRKLIRPAQRHGRNDRFRRKGVIPPMADI
jgi:hypothetical protein